MAKKWSIVQRIHKKNVYAKSVLLKKNRRFIHKLDYCRHADKCQKREHYKICITIKDDQKVTIHIGRLWYPSFLNTCH